MKKENITRQRLVKVFLKSNTELRKLAKSFRSCSGALHYFLEFKELLEEFKEFNRRNGT